MTINGYIISAYATSPSFNKWNDIIESSYFSQLSKNNKIIGIEHPYFEKTDKYPVEWLRKNVPDHWCIILTVLPELMENSNRDPYFGIASMKEASRYKALLMMEKVNEYSKKLNQAFGRDIVKAIHIQSSPKSCGLVNKGDQKSFYKSLGEILYMDWGDISLNIEHCDAFFKNQPVSKGYLPIKEEIEVIKEVGCYGLVLNWGRSAIESRSTDGPLKHIKDAISNHLLKGFIFSGCTKSLSSEYGSWNDTHIPPQNFIDGQYLKADSLLGYEEIYQCLTMLYNQDIYYGIKVLDKSVEKDINHSVGLNYETIKSIEYVKNSIKSSTILFG